MSPREPLIEPDTDLSRPEQVFFEDPALDRMMGVILALATEHCVLRDQLMALESALAKGGFLGPTASQDLAGSSGSEESQQEAAAFAEALLRPLLGVQQANGATGMFSFAGRRRT
jgi:hypothetical protein